MTMSTSTRNYFGLWNSKTTSDQNTEPEKTAIRALPASWYNSQEMYNFERRAIFSRRWLFITHRSRLQKTGDYLRYSIAGFDFIINLDRNATVRAFHNVCRHRAYQVVEQEQDHGNLKLFACRYHGWSYGLDGKLAKAPNYQELAGFDKERNGLLPIHVHIDGNGFIWVNLDSKEQPEIPWEEDFADVDKQERFHRFNFDDYVLDHTYELEGFYNWKILADNFNECYHCKTTHPDVPTFLTIGAHDVATKGGHMQHDHASTPEQQQKGYDVNSTYYFPSTSMSVSPHFLMIQKFLPEGPGNSTMHYEIFRNKNSSEENFKLISEIYARVMAEDKVLCDRAQRNLNAGVFVNGELHPRWEKGPLFFQETVRQVITEHYEREKAAGQEIWSARQRLPDNASISQDDIDICKAITCQAGKEVLAW